MDDFVLLFPPLRPYLLTLSNVFYLFPSLPLFYLSTFLSSGPSQTYIYVRQWKSTVFELDDRYD